MKIDRLDHAPQRREEGAALARPAVALETYMQRIAHLAAVLGLAVLFLLPFVLPLPRHGLSVDIGAEVGLNEFGESREGFYLFDVHSSEQDANGQQFRWTKSFSTMRLLNLFAVGSPLLLELRACDCRPAGAAAATSTLKLNSAAPLPLPLDGQFRSYRILVPHQPSDYGNDLYIEFRGNSFRLPNDDRELGIRLDHVSAVPLASPWSLFGLPPVGAWLLYALVVGGTWAVARRDPHGVRVPSAVRRGVWSALVAIVLLMVPYVYRPHLFTPLVLALLCVVAVWGALLVGRRSLHRFVLAATGLWMVWSAQLLGFWILDDAYISFRYADNMLAGNGLVFNVGERVEGYTNFLWTMIMAVPLAVGLDPTLPSAILTLLIGLGIVWLVYRWGLGDTQHETDLDPGSPISHLLQLFAPVLLAGSTPFLLYTARGSGMETGLFTLLLVAGSLAVQRATERRGLFVAGALLAGATMARPDGVLAVATAGLYLLIRWPLHTGASKQEGADRSVGFLFLVSHLTFLTLGFALFFLPYYAWRYWYYGYPLPNTFYAKVGSGWTQVQRGLDYAGSFAASIGWRFVALVLLLGVGAAVWQRWRSAGGSRRVAAFKAEVVHLVVLVGLYSVYIVYVGGDHFPGFRFFVPILPFLALLLQYALVAIANLPISTHHLRLPSRFSRLSSLISPLAAAGLAGLYLLFTAYQLPASDIGIGWSPVRGEYNVVEKNRELGLWLRDHTPPDTVVATGIAGALPFYSGLRVIDTLGLNDLHIAHLEVEMGAGIAGAEKTDVPYVLDQQPMYIPFSTSGTFQGYPRFEEEYSLIEVRGPEGRAIKLYQRRDGLRP